MLALCTSRAFGLTLFAAIYGIGLERTLVERSLHHGEKQKRDDRSKCSPAVFNKGAKRALLDHDQLIEPNATIARRMMTLPDSSMDAFMVQEIDAAGPVVWDSEVEGEPESSATSVFQNFEGSAFSYGLSGLSGCTAMVLVSRKAVYFGHYWESISFSPDRDWIQKYGSKASCFEDTVIKGLTDGISNGDQPEQESLSGHSQDIDDDFLRGYLIIPTKGPRGKADPYRDLWNKMKSAVGGILPKMADSDRWKEVTYEPLNAGSNIDSNTLDHTARGRLLFKFDPDHENEKKATLWVESENNPPAHDDAW